MKRMISYALACAMLATTTGCVAVSSKNNRIDETIVFHPLSQAHLRAIVDQ